MTLFGLLACACVLMAIVYLWFISNIVMETVSRNQHFQNLKITEREYQELEKNYLNLLAKFNLDYAYLLGFVNENSLASVEQQTAVAQNTGYEQTFR